MNSPTVLRISQRQVVGAREGKEDEDGMLKSGGVEVE